MAQPTKYKKVVIRSEVKQLHAYPSPLVIISDGNELEYVRHEGDRVTYKYGNGWKKGGELTLTNEQLGRMLGWQTWPSQCIRNCTVVAKINPAKYLEL